MRAYPGKKLKTVIDALNPILIVSKLAAVCAIRKDAEKKEFVVSHLLVCFQIAVSILSVAHLAFIPYGVICMQKLSQEKDNEESDQGLSSQAFITKMANIVLISVTAIAVRVSNLLQMHKVLPSLLKNISGLDYSLNTKKDALWILVFSVVLILFSWPYQLYSIIMVTTNNWMAFVIFSLNLYNNFSIISCEFQFISLCWVIKSRFTGLNEELRDLGLSIVVDAPDESVLNRINRIRRSYRILNETCSQLNILYSFQLLSILTSLSLCVLFNLYFAIFGGFKRDSAAAIESEAAQVSGAMNDIIWSFYYFGRLFLICIAAGHLTDQANFTKKLISNIMHRSLENNIKQELWTFLAYTLANEIRFTACGFFKVDIALITSAVSTGATYLVILAQFQVKR